LLVSPSLNKNFSDMLSALNDAGAEYLVVGAYAMASYGNVRATGDIDIWVRPTAENATKVWYALKAFGIPREWVKDKGELTDSDAVFMFGVPPERIDILTSITGVDFESAWANRQVAEFEGVQALVPHWRDLLANKRATGRLKDAADAEWIEVIMRRRGETI
jgi:hypothetical protein